MTYIPHTIGKVYDVAHLRPFDLELARAGHPVAVHNGDEVSHIFIDQDEISATFRHWQKFRLHGCWLYHSLPYHKNSVGKYLRLAPLAIKHDPRTGKDEPLHVGDVIEYEHDEYSQSGDFVNVKVELTNSKPIDYWDAFLKFGNWRWPAEVQG